MRRVGVIAGLVIVALGAPGGRVAAQGKFPPDSFKNLKVLPKTIGQRALLDTMRGFALALGVRCVYCHVGKEGQPLDSVNFRSDDKRTKRAARVMMHMVMHINEEHLADVPDRPKPHVVVKCETCHRGVARPRPLDDDLALMLADSGIDATLRRYRALRDQYYGSGSYDFRELSLNLLAGSEARSGRPDNAIALLKLNAEFYPSSAQIPFLLGESALAKADTAAALADYKEALARDSTNGAARRRIAALGGGQRP
jgi:hypothetical protein